MTKISARIAIPRIKAETLEKEKALSRLLARDDVKKIDCCNLPDHYQSPEKDRCGHHSNWLKHHSKLFQEPHQEPCPDE
jgi:hypothetical protein